MKQAVLYVGHGSRLRKAGQEAVRFLKGCMEKVDAPIQEISFLELTEPTIEEGFRSCIEQGATHIAIVPLLLLTAGHAKKDIPEEIHEMAEKYPDVTVTYGKPIGVNSDVVQAVFERIKETNVDYENSRIILIGRGSSDPDIKRDVCQIADMLQQMGPVNEVIPCFLTACEPNYKDVFRQLKKNDGSATFIVPYLLFTGLLMKEIEKETVALKSYHSNLHLCSYIGFHPYVEQAFLTRVNEAIRNENNSFLFLETHQL
ncbi:MULTISPECIES: sirohydrochlorin chelatase [Bacillus]|uniref:Sirohydrochlorin ferrochelatase n=2 Tax=Bacillus TaxID=1386 RepID=A0A0M4G7I6_9BACI|nr:MULTISPECIES: sirohydrochlorin chelatase [Bacillus]ALC81003.1 sirohydrochlorin ferrochelatase [Bacillus gobiensis]MBP1079957.1 sirohydrochlorin ferrochelatase [Bacillus capparidis]MED1095344.1 sirohydrochlorin chelatase [Bacillus capparidis]